MYHDAPAPDAPRPPPASVPGRRLPHSGSSARESSPAGSESSRAGSESSRAGSEDPSQAAADALRLSVGGRQEAGAGSESAFDGVDAPAGTPDAIVQLAAAAADVVAALQAAQVRPCGGAEPRPRGRRSGCGDTRFMMTWHS